MSPFRIPHRCESGAGPSDYLLMQNHGKIPSNIMHARINMHVQHLDNQTHNKITGLNSSLQVMQGCFVLQVAPLLLHTPIRKCKVLADKTVIKKSINKTRR